MQCCWLGRWRKWAVNQGMWEASKAGKGKEQILPRASRRECSPVNTLMSAQWDPCQTSNIRNYEVIYLYCFKPFKSSVICHNSNKKQTRHEMHSFWLCQLKPVTHTCTHAHAHTGTHQFYLASSFYPKQRNMQDTPLVDFRNAGCFLPGLCKVHEETCWRPLLAITNSSTAQPGGLCQLQSHPGHSNSRALSSAPHMSW